MKHHRWGPSYDPDYRQCQDCQKTVCVHWRGWQTADCPGKPVTRKKVRKAGDEVPNEHA